MNIKLPPLPPYHARPYDEQDEILQSYATLAVEQALAKQAARHSEELLAHEVTVKNLEAEIARMKTELHQHECNDFGSVREQRDFLLASQTLLIESAKAGQDAQAAEIERLRAQRVPDGWILVHVNRLREWKDKVNTLASLTASSDRRERGIALKQAIADTISSAPHPSQPERKPMTDEKKEELVGTWFAEDWAQKSALGMLDDYEKFNGIKP